MINKLKCYDSKGNRCFACENGICQLLKTYVDEKSRRRHGTKSYVDDGCPFRKTTDETKGTYRELCKQYSMINLGRYQE